MSTVTRLGKELTEMILITSEQYQKPSSKAVAYHEYLLKLLDRCGDDVSIFPPPKSVNDMRRCQESMAERLVLFLDIKCFLGVFEEDFLRKQISKAKRFDCLYAGGQSLFDTSSTSSQSSQEEEEEEEEESSSDSTESSESEEMREKRKPDTLLIKEDIKRVKYDV